MTLQQRQQQLGRAIAERAPELALEMRGEAVEQAAHIAGRCHRRGAALGGGEQVAGRRLVGVDRRQLAQLGLGLVGTAGALQRQMQVAPRRLGRGLDGDDPAAQGDGLVVAPLLEHRPAQADAGLDILRPDGQRPAQMRLRTGPVLDVEQRIAEIEPEARIVRGAGQGLLVKGRRLARPAGGTLQGTQIHQRRHVAGLRRQDLAIEPLGLGTAAGLVMRRRQPQQALGAGRLLPGRCLAWHRMSPECASPAHRHKRLMAQRSTLRQTPDSLGLR